MRASDLLYGTRRRGPGPKEVRDVTDIFFRNCLSQAIESRHLAAADYLMMQHKVDKFGDLREIYEPEELSQELRAIAYDRKRNGFVKPVIPRRQQDIDNRWEICLMTTYRHPFARAHIRSVTARGGRISAEIRMYEEGRDADIIELVKVARFPDESRGESFSDLLGFIEAVTKRTETELANEDRY